MTPRREGYLRFVALPQVVVPGLVVFLIVWIGIFGQYVAPRDPNDLDMGARFRPPSWSHPFGTDDVGRDVFSRTIVGTRYSLLSALLVLAIACSIGALLGLIAGFAGGKVDNVIMRLTDLFFAFPVLILAIAIAAVLGPSLINAVLAIAVVWWPQYARLVRSQVLRLRQQLFVEAARTLGLSERRIALRHVLPSCTNIILARLTVDVGSAILLTATLGFLGLGIRPPQAEWGNMIALARPYFFSYWWTAVFPGLAIFVTVLAASLFGDAINDAITRGHG